MKTAAPIFTKNGHEPRSRRLRCEVPPGQLRLLEKSLKQQSRRYRKWLRCCQVRFTEETIHRTRVEARRLLSTAELLGGFVPAALLKELERTVKCNLDVFDELRDTQVQLPIVGKMRRRFAAAGPFHDYLCRREKRLNKATRKKLRRLKAKPLRRLAVVCRQEAAARRKRCPREQTAAVLLRSVDRAFARTNELRARINPAETDTIHRTRVAFKKFRYMAETLIAYLPKPDKKLCEAMHDYQTMMGDIQDAEVLLRRFDKFLRKCAVPPTPARHLREELMRRRKRLIETYLEKADQMLEFWPWNQYEPVSPPSRTGR